MRNQVCAFPILTRRKTTYNGERKLSTVYMQVRCYGKLKAVVLENIRKGDRCRVTGYLDFFLWRKEDTGESKASVGISVQALTYLRKDEEEDAANE